MSKPKSTLIVQNNSTVTQNASDFRPMLLALGNPEKMNNYPYVLQNKYDGVRCIAIKDINNNIKTFSRNGNEFNVPHLHDALSKIFNKFPAIVHLDGEIYEHGKLLEEISGNVKRNDSSSKVTLWYQIYDIPMQDTKMENRMNILKLISEFTTREKIDNVIKCDCGTTIYNKEDLLEFYKTSLKNKYEGAVATRSDSYYKTDTRSTSKLKLKANDSDEFVCVSHYYGNGKCSNMSTLICATKEAQTLGYANSEVFNSFSLTKPKTFITKYYFHVKMNGNNESREEMSKNFDRDFKNKDITVSYYSLSNNNVPRGAKGIAVRDYE